MLCYNFSSVLAALPILHAVQGRKSVEEHVEQPVVQQDVCQFGAGVDKLQQHTKDVVHQGVLIKGVLNKTQHRDDAAPSERWDIFHFLQVKTVEKETRENNKRRDSQTYSSSESDQCTHCGDWVDNHVSNIIFKVMIPQKKQNILKARTGWKKLLLML